MVARGLGKRPIGFTLSLVAGDGTDVVHAGEPDGGDQFRHIYQASSPTGLRNGVVLEAGVYPSHIGLEGFYSKDNWNYTRGGSASFRRTTRPASKPATRSTRTGRAKLHVLNGWQIIARQQRRQSDRDAARVREWPADRIVEHVPRTGAREDAFGDTSVDL